MPSRPHPDSTSEKGVVPGALPSTPASTHWAHTLPPSLRPSQFVSLFMPYLDTCRHKPAGLRHKAGQASTATERGTGRATRPPSRAIRKQLSSVEGTEGATGSRLHHCWSPGPDQPLTSPTQQAEATRHGLWPDSGVPGIIGHGLLREQPLSIRAAEGQAL